MEAGNTAGIFGRISPAPDKSIPTMIEMKRVNGVWKVKFENASPLSMLEASKCLIDMHADYLITMQNAQAEANENTTKN